MVFRKRRSSSDGDTDEDLMERYRDGDVAAFERLLERHEQKVFHFIYRYVRERETANELLQEAFLRVVKVAGTYSRKAKFTTWLYTIARNLCIDHVRKARHRRTLSLDTPHGDDPEGPTLMDRIPDADSDAYRRTDAAEIKARVEQAIGQLSNEQREVFVMRQFQTLAFKDIAAVVGVSENTIKSRMRYALENLRLALADYADELPTRVDVIPARSRG